MVQILQYICVALGRVLIVLGGSLLATYVSTEIYTYIYLLRHGIARSELSNDYGFGFDIVLVAACTLFISLIVLFILQKKYFHPLKKTD